MRAFDLLALLLTLAGLLGYLSHRWLRLPTTIGVLILATVGTVALLALDRLCPDLQLKGSLHALLGGVDLPSSFLDGFLCLLLFAGALQLDLQALLSRKWTIAVLATAGVALSTFLLGAASWTVFHFLGVEMAFGWCLVLGAIIAPTDPVAVLGALKRVGLPETLQATIAGESVFNDGVAIVLFTVLIGAATGDTGENLEGAPKRFLIEVGGAGLLGLGAGWLAVAILRTIDEYNLELLLALALTLSTYSIAHLLGVSGPIAVVIAGVLIGNQGRRYAMSKDTRQHLAAFWGLVDEALNAVLFLLIGLEIAVLEIGLVDLAAALLIVPLMLLVRAVSIAAPALPLHLHRRHKARIIALMTWGGLRGGISIALALALPETPAKQHILAATYAVVLFTMIVQGLSFERLARRLFPAVARISEHRD
jgi:CPA1 family monovalent cation:H+ antiporter